ncbi:MAG TPA: M56 family metallopeptidase [Mucilaginibacter sp.]|nr:M56 family metallopeptidase [Mucilaginibacter sp.]
MLAFITGNLSAIHRLISAVGTTLVCSLWLGMACALITAMLLTATRNLRAATRYQLLTALLMLFAAAIGLIFIQELAHQNPAPVAAVPYGTPLVHYLYRYDTEMVYIWLLVICFKSVGMGIGLQRLYRMKHTQIQTASNCAQEMLARLAGQLQISAAIGLLESGLAKVPMVIGFLKPVILVPVGLLTALSPEEAEAILLHELAHIRRRDFLVSLLQHVLEILFFFNPAVLWLSYLIRREREHCCDDLVIAQTDNKISYIHALLSCQAWQPEAFAMTLFSHRKQLLGRVRRMTGRPDPAINRLEKTMLALSLVGAVYCTAAFSGLTDARNTGTPHRLIHYHTKDGKTGVIDPDRLSLKNKISPDDPDETILRKLAAELTKKKLIGGLASLNGLKLNDRVFEVNGTQLPEALRSQYKNKYLPQAGYGIYYGDVRFSGRGTFIIIPKLKS